jgi:hypothetical protein
MDLASKRGGMVFFFTRFYVEIEMIFLGLIIAYFSQFTLHEFLVN